MESVIKEIMKQAKITFYCYHGKSTGYFFDGSVEGYKLIIEDEKAEDFTLILDSLNELSTPNGLVFTTFEVGNLSKMGIFFLDLHNLLKIKKCCIKFYNEFLNDVKVLLEDSSVVGKMDDVKKIKARSIYINEEHASNLSEVMLNLSNLMEAVKEGMDNPRLEDCYECLEFVRN